MKNKLKAGSRKPEAGSRKLRVKSSARFDCAPGLLSSCLLLFTFCLLSASAQQTRPTPAVTNAPETAPRGPLTYDSFRLLHTRNVFDPDRRPVRPAGAVNAAPAGRGDYLALTGTLLDAGKSYAFFSGSRTDFNKVLSVKDKIADATITQITPLHIVVTRGGKSTTVGVGQTVPLDEKSVPGAVPSNLAEVTATSIDRPAAGTGDGAALVSANPAAAAPVPGGAKPLGTSKEELMRKMMERRQQELK